MSTRGGEFCRKHGCGYVGRCPACTQDELLAYRSGHSIGFGCAAIDSEAARLRRDLSEAIRLLREVEWHGFYGDTQCPFCEHYKLENQEHTPDCRLAALLAKYPEVK